MAQIKTESGTVTLPDSYTEGKSPEEIQQLVEQMAAQGGWKSSRQISGGEDAARGLGAGLKEGVESLIGVARGTGNTLARGASWAADWMGLDDPQSAAFTEAFRSGGAGPVAVATDVLKRFGGPDYTQAVTPDPSTVAGLLDKTPLAELDYDPASRLGKVLKTGGSIIPSAMLMGAGPISGRIGSGLAMGAGSELAGEATEGTMLEPYARFAGGVLAPTVVSGLNRLTRPAGTIKPDVVRAGQELEREGVTSFTAGQRTGNRDIQRIESEIGGGRYEGIVDEGAAQLTQAALRRSGNLDPRATGQGLLMNRERIGSEFDRLAAATTIPHDITLMHGLRGIIRDFRQGTGAHSPALQEIRDKVLALGRTNNNQIPGRSYQSLMQDIRNASSSATPELQRSLSAMREAIDQAVERGLRASPNIDPNLLARWQVAREQWRNQLIIEDAIANGAAQNQFSGVISPAQLNASANTIEGISRSATGRSDLANLGAAGQTIMKPLATSETAARSVARNPAAIPLAILSAIQGSKLMSPGWQKYLASQGPQFPLMDGRNLLSLATSFMGQHGEAPAPVEETAPVPLPDLATIPVDPRLVPRPYVR